MRNSIETSNKMYTQFLLGLNKRYGHNTLAAAIFLNVIIISTTYIDWGEYDAWFHYIGTVKLRGTRNEQNYKLKNSCRQL